MYKFHNSYFVFFVIVCNLGIFIFYIFCIFIFFICIVYFVYLFIDGHRGFISIPLGLDGWKVSLSALASSRCADAAPSEMTLECVQLKVAHASKAYALQQRHRHQLERTATEAEGTCILYFIYFVTFVIFIFCIFCIYFIYFIFLYILYIIYIYIYIYICLHVFIITIFIAWGHSPVSLFVLIRGNKLQCLVAGRRSRGAAGLARRSARA